MMAQEKERIADLAVSLDGQVKKLAEENRRLQSELGVSPNGKRGLPGAGRKRKATDREITLIRKLHEKGHSLSEISRLVEGETGVKLSRTTVWNLLNKPLANKLEADGESFE